MPDKSFADLLREAGVQPSGAIQYAQSLNRPVPYRSYTPPRPLPRRMRPADVRAYDDNPGVAQQAMGEMRRDRMTGQDAMLREAQGPASNQFADAGMVALETTGVPALRRSYDAFEAGDPRQGIYEGIWGGLGLAGTLGAIPGARRTPRAPMREPVLPQMREPPAPPQSLWQHGTLDVRARQIERDGFRVGPDGFVWMTDSSDLASAHGRNQASAARSSGVRPAVVQASTDGLNLKEVDAAGRNVDTLEFTRDLESQYDGVLIRNAIDGAMGNEPATIVGVRENAAPRIGNRRMASSDGSPDGMPPRAPDAGNGRAEQVPDIGSAGQPRFRYEGEYGGTSYSAPGRAYSIPAGNASADLRITADGVVSWGLLLPDNANASSLSAAERSQIGLRAIRGVLEALHDDAVRTGTNRYRFSGAGETRQALYRELGRQAERYGYRMSEPEQGSFVLQGEVLRPGVITDTSKMSLEELRARAATMRSPEEQIGMSVPEFRAMTERARDPLTRGENNAAANAEQTVYGVLSRAPGDHIRSRFGPASDAPTAGPSRPPPDTAKSYRPGPPKGGFFFSRRR